MHTQAHDGLVKGEANFSTTIFHGGRLGRRVSDVGALKDGLHSSVRIMRYPWLQSQAELGLRTDQLTSVEVRDSTSHTQFGTGQELLG